MGSMGMVILRIDNRFQDKAILLHLCITMRGFVTIYLMGNIVSLDGLLVVGVVKRVNVGIWTVEMPVMDVVRVVI